MGVAAPEVNVYDIDTNEREREGEGEQERESLSVSQTQTKAFHPGNIYDSMYIHIVCSMYMKGKMGQVVRNRFRPT